MSNAERQIRWRMANPERSKQLKNASSDKVRARARGLSVEQYRLLILANAEARAKAKEDAIAERRHRQSAPRQPPPKRITHGMNRTPEYEAWHRMKQRCGNPKVWNYGRYGGRGIRVCDEWAGDFQAFYDYVGSRPSPNHSIDRYPDNDGDYRPGNVRWATRSEQQWHRQIGSSAAVRGWR